MAVPLLLESEGEVGVENLVAQVNHNGIHTCTEETQSTIQSLLVIKKSAETKCLSLPVYLKGAPLQMGKTSIIRYKKASSKYPNPASSKMKDRDL